MLPRKAKTYVSIGDTLLPSTLKGFDEHSKTTDFYSADFKEALRLWRSEMLFRAHVEILFWNHYV
jgi:hypothetical protein